MPADGLKLTPKLLKEHKLYHPLIVGAFGHEHNDSYQLHLQNLHARELVQQAEVYLGPGNESRL
jgi:hypothetical protein